MSWQTLLKYAISPPANNADNLAVEVTGRLQNVRNDGLVDKQNWLAGRNRTHGFETDEGSLFLSVSYRMPGTFFGGIARLGGVVGYNKLNTELVPTENLGGTKGRIGSIENESLLYGGSLLWPRGGLYSLWGIVGHTGDSDLKNKNTAAIETYKNDTHGFIYSSATGYLVPLAPWTGGAMLDLRLSSGYSAS